MRYASLFNLACAISYGPHNTVIFLYCFSLKMFEGRHRPHHFWPNTNERPLFKLYFTKTIHISVLPFGFQSKTTSKCGRKKKSGTQAAAECGTVILAACLCLLELCFFVYGEHQSPRSHD